MGNMLAAAPAMYRGCTDGAQEVPGVFGPFRVTTILQSCRREGQGAGSLLAKVTPETAC